MVSVAWLLICLSFSLSVVAGETVDATSGPEKAVCPGKSVQYLSVLTGVGWDNLVNEERGPTIERSKYSLCKTSLDGRYLIPDNMNVEPKKNSEVDMSSDIIDSTSECKSLTALTINSAIDFSYASFKINGDFSAEKENIRESMKNLHGLIVRTHLRHKRYSVFQLPDSQLHPRLRNRLLDIAAHLDRGNVTIELIDKYDKGDTGTINRKGNDTPMDEHLLALEEGMHAFYLADLIVRDYGTHSINMVDAGGVLVKTDTLDDQSLRLGKKDRLKISSSAGLAFANLLKVESGGSWSSNKTAVENYKQRVTNSRVTSYGGPIFRAHNMSLAMWEEQLDSELVAIDRNGVPIFDLITPWSMPELKEDIILRLVKTLKSAVERYYMANAVVGCLDPTSVYYDNDANVASRECSGPKQVMVEDTNLPLGGVYQTCIGPEQICSTVQIKNPATGDYTCSTGYLAVQLLPSQTKSCITVCTDESWTKRKECHQECAETKAFWCTLDPSLDPRSHGNASSGQHPNLGGGGFLFGGLYTDKEVNLVTQQFTCPEYSWVIPIGRRMRVCLSSDRVMGIHNSIPFGGFYSCRFGNPLVAVLSIENDTLSVEKRNMASFWKRSWRSSAVQQQYEETNLRGPRATEAEVGSEFDNLFSQAWPKQCPRGYTAHAAAMEDMCQVNFCIPSNTRRGERKRYLKRPPFVRPLPFYHTTDHQSTVDHIVDRPLYLRDVYGHRLERSILGEWEDPTRNFEEKLELAETHNVVNVVLGTLLTVTVLVCMALGCTVFLQHRKQHRPLDQMDV